MAGKSKIGTFRELPPVSYASSDHRKVDISYKLSGNLLSYVAGSTLPEAYIIDPEVYWGTYLKSLQPDLESQSILGADIETDPQSNIVTLLSAEVKVPFPTADPGNGAWVQDFSTVTGGAMILTKFSPSGQMLWSTYFAGNGWTAGKQLAIDNFGNISVAGDILSEFSVLYSDIPLKDRGGYFNNKPSSSFLSRFDKDGKLTWSTFFAEGLNVQDMAADSKGGFYITGYTGYLQLPLVDAGNGSYFQNNPGSPVVTFLSAFDSSCNLTWSTYIKGTGNSFRNRIAVDKKGTVYLGTAQASTDMPLKDAGGYYNDVASGAGVMKFTSARQLIWGTLLPIRNGFSDMVTDDSGSIYISHGRGELIKFKANTSQAWTRQYNNSHGYGIEDMVFDPHNNMIHLLGIMNDLYDNFPTKNSFCQGTFFFNGQSPFKYYSSTGPLFISYSTDGNLMYGSLADWPGLTYWNSSFCADKNGNLIYLFKEIENPGPDPQYLIPSLKNPGNDAYYQEGYNWSYTPFLMKLKYGGIAADAKLSLSEGCECSNKAEITVTCGIPPYTYTWSNGDSTAAILNLCVGEYDVTITDAAHQSKVLHISIPKPAGSITSFTTNVANAHCDKKDAFIKISGITGGTSPYLYAINDIDFLNKPDFTGLDSGSYVVTVKDAGGCIAKDTVLISHIKGPSKIISSIEPAGCNSNDGAILIDSIIGGTFPVTAAINNSTFDQNTHFTNLEPGRYKVTVQDSAGCTYSDSLAVAVSPGPDSLSVILSPDHCMSSLGRIEVENVYGGVAPYLFSTDGNTYTTQLNASNLSQGEYPVYVKDSKNCFLHRIFTVENIPGPNHMFFQPGDAVCGKQKGYLELDSVIGGTKPYFYSLDNGPKQSVTSFDDILPGGHQITVEDNYGCMLYDSFYIAYIPSPQFSISPKDTSVCYGESITFRLVYNDSAAIKHVLWPGNQNNRHLYTTKATGNNWVPVTITDFNNCVLTDSAFFSLKACNSGQNCMAIPTAFTPNGDGLNDYIGPVEHGCPVTDFHFFVYNRYGQPIFESKDKDRKWDGRYQGNTQPTGVYIYTCTFKDEKGQQQTLKGTITLIH
ncbi:gliding motility-associated C-terminal domain-containing protein [Foetidibacter luteolus]|uniref:T9SS type B sorting domain-containing protein n=1 Tax=Foetidibacter luteolus TaxID=2608880 RepID=UPI00129A3492|nr:gliding motility-associated C-terminal domain-containing protein [Foetidibacter luteolus]